MPDEGDKQMSLYFTKDHEWLQLEGDIATVGITDYAQAQLGDVVFVELPALGKALTEHGEAAIVESVKAASDVYAPLAGAVVAVNTALETDPALVNTDPLGQGWFFKMKLQNIEAVSALLDQEGYNSFVASLEG
jgi:glycine cleavage system H protein